MSFGINSKSVCNWVENPYWQYFCGEEFFQHELPINPSSMTRWRDRVKSENLGKLLEETIRAGLRIGILKKNDLKKVNVDTTVSEKKATQVDVEKVGN